MSSTDGRLVPCPAPAEVAEALREREQRYALATAAGRVAARDLHLVRDVLIAAPPLTEFWGVGPAKPGAAGTWLAVLHPDDRPAVAEAFNEYVAARAAEFRCEYRVPLADGSVRWGFT